MQIKDIDELINNIGDELYTFCTRLSYNRNDGEDLYQDTMVKLYTLVDKIDFKNNPKAFSYSLAISINNNKLRKFLRRSRIAPEISIDTQTNNYISSNKNTVDEIILKEESSFVYVALDKLSERQKEVILMYYMADLSVSEISHYLKIPEGTIKSRLHNSRLVLKKELEMMGYER